MTELGPLLDARSVAVIGASADASRIGGRPIAYLKTSGFSGRIVPVNPNRATIQGLPAFADLRETDPVDLAVIATPATAVDDAIDAAMEAGARALILFTAGYGETGSLGRAAQDRLAARVAREGAVLLGPNCLGAVNFRTGMVATFATNLETAWPELGGFSYMGQSGALGTYWIELCRRAGLGVAKWITTGNEAQINVAHALDFLACDPDTRIIASYIEDIKDPEMFARAAERARSAGKRLLALKSGRSEIGRIAAAHHTGSAPLDDGWYDSFFREIGATRLSSLTELVDVAKMGLAANPISSSRRLGIVSVSGGAGILACDVADDLGVGLASLSEATQRELAAVLPGYAPTQNPVDVTGALVSDPDLLGKVVSIMTRSGEVDAILIFLGAMEGISERLVQNISDACADGAPMAVIWIAGPEAALARLRSAHIPVYAEIEPAVRAIALAQPTGWSGNWPIGTTAAIAGGRSFGETSHQIPQA